MSNIEALKEQARQHEQKEEWQKACDQYMLAIEELDDEEQPDIGLFNRVGDLLIRLGNYEQALEHFDKAADLYVEADLPNNAIAICKKVIRHLPNRTETYLRMGKIRADQGFLVDARESYLTYVEKVQGGGDMEEALRALGEFAELAPEDTEVRMAVAEQLIQHERPEEALDQLAAGYAVLMQREDEEAASAFEEKILELDPDADLEAMAQATPAAEETFDQGFGFETTTLDDSFEDEVTADFGEIVFGGAEGDQGDEDDAADEGEADEAVVEVEAAEEGGMAVGDFQEIALGDEDADGEDETTTPDFELGADEDGLDDADDGFDPADDGFGVAEDEFDDEDVEGAEIPFMSLDDEEEEADDLPLLSDFAAEALDGDQDEAEPAPLPFLSDEDEDEGQYDAEEQHEDEEEVSADFDTSGASVDEIAEDEVADVLAEAMEEGAAESLQELEEEEEDSRAEWEALFARVQDGEPEADSAQQLVELAFKLDDQDALVRSYLHLADALVAGEDEARARGVYEQVLSLDPENERAREALEEETAAADETPVEQEEEDTSGDYVDLGSLIFDEPEEKTTRFRVAYEEPSGDEEADFAKMLNQFKAKVAENIDVADVKAHHDLGTAYKEMGLLDEAVEKFQEALRASPGHLPTYELLGQTFMEKGEPIAAVRVLERALKVPHQIEDELIGIYYFLGRAQEDVGNTEAAIEFYDRVFALDINFGDVTERLRKLR